MSPIRKLGGLAALLLAVIGPATDARGASITSGNAPQVDDENVLLARPELLSTGPTVQGWTNQQQFVVDFSSTTKLGAPSHGQAKIRPLTAGSFSDLSIALHDAGATFNSLIFNLDAVTSGTTWVTLFGADGDVLQSQQVTVRGKGSNFFTVVAGMTESFSRVSISGGVGFSNAAQFRIGGAGFEPLAVIAPLPPGLNPDNSQVAVPAPASASGGAALIGLYAARRRRARGLT